MRRVAWLAFACGGSAAPPVDAPPPGTLDPGFGVSGSVITTTPGQVLALDVDADRILAIVQAPDDSIASVRVGTDGTILAATETGVKVAAGVAIGGAGRVGDAVVVPTFDKVAILDAGGALTTTTAAPNNESWHSVRGGAHAVVCGTFDDPTPQVVVERFDVATGGDMTVRFAGSSGTLLDCEPAGDGVVFVGRQSNNEALFGRVDGAMQPQVGSDGAVVLTIPADARSVAPLGNDFVVSGVVGGDFGVIRVHADGTVEPSFGSGGAVTTPIATNPGNAFAVTVAGDRVIAAGATSQSLDAPDATGAVVRYDGSGALDPTFGSGGIVPLGIGTRAFAMAIDPAGRIVIAGDTNDPTGARVAYIARLLP